jgi:hypothetical protein
MIRDYEKLRKSWLEYWARENHDRPIMSLTAQADSRTGGKITPPDTLFERWTDAEYIEKAFRIHIQNTYFAGEAFPVLNANLGPDQIGAVCGCGVEFGKDTSWALHNVTDWEKEPPIRFNEKNVWWRRIESMTRYFAACANGDYLVGVTDLHPGTDALVSLRGPEELCLDLTDCPEEVNKRIDEVFSVYREIFDRLCAIVAPYQEGAANWTGIWHPGKRWYPVCSDFSCMVGANDFERFVIPGLMREIDYLDASIYHLDGPGALRHLERILEIDKLGGVQWVYGDGLPTARFWIDVLKKIQTAGKLIQIHCVPGDIPDLCEALDCEGLNIVCHTKSPKDADDLISAAERIYLCRKKASVPVTK